MSKLKPQTVIAAIANANFARLNCLRTVETSPNADNVNHAMEWSQRHGETISTLVRDFLPSGSGFDGGTTFDFDGSTVDVLRFQTAFHHMSEHGFYMRWTEHRVTIRPSLCFGFLVSVSGRNYRDIKDYIAETFELALSRRVIAVLTTIVGETLPTVTFKPADDSPAPAAVGEAPK